MQSTVEWINKNDKIIFDMGQIAGGKLKPSEVPYNIINSW